MFWTYSPSPLIPFPSRERGLVGRFVLLSAPPPHFWIADQVRNDGTGWLVCIVVILAFDSPPIKETFAKLSETAISGADCKYPKLHFPIDSRLRGNDCRFCKGLLDGRGIKEPVPVLDTGSEGEIKTPTPLRYCTQNPKRNAAIPHQQLQ